MKEMGISEAVVYSLLRRCNIEDVSEFFNNILLTGGNCLFEGMKERTTEEIRSLAPSHCDVRVTLPSNPIFYAWGGGVLLSNDDLFPSMCVTRAEYLENGENICAQRFVS
ncbi:unnamed protein product [Soboliphyme baturini]|uniref:RibD_C domain-containing protein n=1 Tax=Soboliphyme baturini TaxID=241478 RepID=A0A183IZF8_9BILA|nr:unnamed protein product [Soboliphyme baturini]